MAPRRKDPKLTLEAVSAWCNQNGFWLIKQPEIKLGTVQFQIYRVASDELLCVLKQTSGKLFVTGEDDEG